MPNLVVLVSNVVPEDGQLRLAFISWTDQGAEAGGGVVLDFSANAAQIHSAVIDAAKSLQAAMHGITFLPADKIQLWGGRSV